MANPGSNGGPTRGGGLTLPDGCSGLVLVGRLDFVAISARNAKQLVIDVEARTAEGRRSIESLSCFVANQDGEPSAMGTFYASGDLAKLVGQQVAVLVSVRAAKGGDRVYMTAEAIHPLGAAVSV